MTGLVTGCRSCGGRLAVTMADLGLQPVSNAFIASLEAARGEKRYPLRAKVCESCKLVQLDYDVAPEELFARNYVYFSSYSDDWLTHAKEYCDMARRRFGLGAESLVVELGDGRQADLIIGNNVLAHVPLLNDFVAGIALLLKPRGSVTIEFPHLLELIEHVEFDTIYHEHYSYISLYAIERVFSRHGLRIYDVEQLPTHGGSLRIFAAHSNRPDLEDSGLLRKVRAQESAAGLADLGTYLRFAERVESCRRSLLAFLAEAKREGKTVAGYGAAAKGNTLLNFCGVTPADVSRVADRNPHKQSKFLPGTHIPVVSPEALLQARPDYVLILPWNLQDEIRRQLQEITQWGGRFVTPVPEIRIYA